MKMHCTDNEASRKRVGPDESGAIGFRGYRGPRIKSCTSRLIHSQRNRRELEAVTLWHGEFPRGTLVDVTDFEVWKRLTEQNSYCVGLVKLQACIPEISLGQMTKN